MEKLCRALFRSQNDSSKKNTEVAFSCETPEESLKNWKLPPSSASDVYKPSGVFSSSIIETVEEEISLSEGYATFPLFPDNLKRAYHKKYRFLHFGMIQVGLKPTKLGSNASAILCLRDKRHLKFDESVLGMVESSLCDGPIYFSYFPPDYCRYYFLSPNGKSPLVSLSEDLSSSFSIDIKTEGCSRDENIVLLYKLHYKVMHKRCQPRTTYLSRYRVDKEGITTVFLTDVAQTNHVWPKKISWYADAAIPERWAEWRETAKNHLLQVDVPAELKKEEVEVSFEAGRILRITGERSNNNDKNKWSVLKSVNCIFLRRLRVPENSKLEEVTAVMENGWLLVEVPKAEVNHESEEKAVQIKG